MLSNNALAGALIFILIVLGANALMYGIARRMSKGGDARWINALKEGLTRPMGNRNNTSIEELRQKVEKLDKERRKEE